MDEKLRQKIQDAMKKEQENTDFLQVTVKMENGETFEKSADAIVGITLTMTPSEIDGEEGLEVSVGELIMGEFSLMSLPGLLGALDRLKEHILEQAIKNVINS